MVDFIAPRKRSLLAMMCCAVVVASLCLLDDVQAKALLAGLIIVLLIDYQMAANPAEDRTSSRTKIRDDRSIEVGVDRSQLALCDTETPRPSDRSSPNHPVSGLPMREALLARMVADRRGILGAIAFTDFNRLTAFDPVMAEQVFATAIARLLKMLPPARFAAQVDRGQVGLWFGAAVDEAEARAELDAIAYALKEEIAAGDKFITPQINVRMATFDDCDMDAGAFLARTLATFSLTAETQHVAGPTIDYGALARDHYALEQDLRQAIARRELRLEFQPLVDAMAGSVCGAEALLRWDHADRGAISPSRFIPIVERMGLANEIGMWALNTAARQAAEWRAAGLGQLRVAVNVSGIQLERDDLPILVQRTLDRHELGANALEIELTESIATSNTDHCRRVFHDLRAMGIKLAVDDFGTGYSGFSSLRTLAFDKIKIDREFITDVDTRADSQAICQSIVALGRGLGIRVLAEGVERWQEYEWLRRHGCRHFQGFYFGRPMSGPAFIDFVRDTDRLRGLLTFGPDRIEARLTA